MKSLQRLLTAVTLTFMLALPAFAGYMSTPVAPPPPPPQDSPVTNGHMNTGITGETDAPATQVALNLLQSVLGLF